MVCDICVCYVMAILAAYFISSFHYIRPQVIFSYDLLQVTSVIGNNNLYGHSGNVIPTLGLTWANLVTTRLMIGRTDSYMQAEQTEDSRQVNKSSSKTLVEYNIRELEVIFCPWLRKKSCPFVVTSKGIEDVE